MITYIGCIKRYGRIFEIRDSSWSKDHSKYTQRISSQRKSEKIVNLETIFKTPNPFNPETQIEFQLPEAANVDISVFNMSGEKITTLVEKCNTAGSYIVNWLGTDENGLAVSSGVYFYSLRAGKLISVKKMTLLQ